MLKLWKTKIRTDLGSDPIHGLFFAVILVFPFEPDGVLDQFAFHCLFGSDLCN